MATATGAYATAAALKSRVGITDVTDDTVLGTICDQVNQYIETFTGRVLAPVTSGDFLLDVPEPTDRLYFPRGLRSVSAVTVGDYTGAARVALASGDYFLRPAAHDRRPGWPATWLHLSDACATRSYFPAGYDIVKVTGTTGWDAIPDDITEVALTAATRAWHGVQSAQTDVVGTDEMGRPVVSRFFSARDLGTLRTYSVDVP
jgi:hypothetical protein